MTEAPDRAERARAIATLIDAGAHGLRDSSPGEAMTSAPDLAEHVRAIATRDRDVVIDAGAGHQEMRRRR